MHSSGTLRIAIVIALLLAPAAIPTPAGATHTTPPPPLFLEEWDDGLAGWTVTGSGATGTCSDGAPYGYGCSLRLSPPCCSSPVTVESHPHIPMVSDVLVTVYFEGLSRSGDTDASFNVYLNGGGHLSLGVSDGISPNTGIAFYSAGAGGGRFAYWPYANEWNQASIVIRPQYDYAYAVFYDIWGTPIAYSPDYAIPASSEFIETLSFSAIQWGSYAFSPFLFDALRVDGTAPQPPTAPRNLAATGGIQQVQLTWQAPSISGTGPVTAYTVYRRNLSSGADEPVATLPAANTSYTDRGLAHGTTYAYKVSASNRWVEGSKTAAVSATTLRPPSAPRNAWGMPNGLNADLYWDFPASSGSRPLQGYHIYRGDTPNGEVRVATMGPDPNRHYFDQGLGVNRTYYYFITAFNEIGESPPSNEFSLLTPDFPTEPVNVVASRGVLENIVTWDPPVFDGRDSIYAYAIYRGDAFEGERAFLAYSYPWDSGTEFRDGSASPTENYAYEVSAINSVGEGPRSAEALTTTGAPSAPQNLRAVPEHARVRLTWDAPATSGVTPVSYYEVRRTTDGAAPVRFTTTARTFLDTGLQNGRVYTYDVRAANSMGPGAWSTEESARPPGAPGAPTTLSASSSADREATLTWSPPTTNAAAVVGYRLYRSHEREAYELVATVNGATTLRFVDRGLEKGGTYYWQVRAWSGYEESGPSPTASIRVPWTPEAPTGLTVIEGDRRVELSWTAPAENGGPAVREYRVMRSENGGEGKQVARIPAADTRYVDTEKLVNGRLYTYRIIAQNPEGQGPASEPAGAIPRTIPAAPRAFTATPRHTAVDLAWEAPPSDGGAEIFAYVISRAEGNGTATLVADLPGTERAWRDEEVVDGIEYRYEIVAENLAGQGPAAYATATPGPEPPAAPTGLTATPDGFSYLLSWTPSANDGGSPFLDQYVYHAVGGCGNLTFLSAVPAEANAFEDWGVEYGLTHCYAVEARTALGSARSTPVSVFNPTTPDQPENVTAAPGDRSMTVQWTAPSRTGGAPITAYHVYWSAPGAWDFPNRVQVPATETTTTLTGLENGVDYTAYVTAENEAGEGLPSPWVNATPRTAPDTPREFRAYGGPSGNLLMWEPPASDGWAPLLGYRVYREVAGSGWSVIAETDAYGTAASDYSAAPGVTYSYRVTAVNAAGESGPTASAKATVGSPDAPRNLAYWDSGPDSVYLYWEAPATPGLGLAGYTVERRTADGDVKVWSTGAAWFEDTTALRGNEYQYSVSATNAFGTGEPARLIVSKEGAPTAPQNVKGYRVGVYGVSLAWDPPAYPGSGVMGYYVYAGETCESAGYIGQTPAEGTTFTDSYIRDPQYQCYYVRAFDTLDRMGDASAPVYPDLASAPGSPENVTATGGNSMATLRWDAPTTGGEVEEYFIEWTWCDWRAGICWSDTVHLPPEARSHTATGLENGREVEFFIAAVNFYGASPGAFAWATPSVEPGAPSDVIVEEHEQDVHVLWDGAGWPSFRVYRSTDEGPLGLVADQEEPIYVDTAAAEGGFYCYAIEGYSGTAVSPRSEPVCIARHWVPLAPRDFQADVSGQTVTLSWSPPLSPGRLPIEGYILSRATQGPAGFVEEWALGPEARTFTDMPGAGAYTYRLTAWNAAGVGAAAAVDVVVSPV